MNKGVITIKGLELDVHVGVYDEERSIPQKIIVDVEIYTDITKACETDDIGMALDYMPLVERVREYVLSHEHKLIERYAKELLSIFLSHPRAEKVRLEFKKPEILSDADYVSVRVEEWKS